MSSIWAKSAKGAKGLTRQMNTLLNLKNVTFDRRKKSSLPTYGRQKKLKVVQETKMVREERKKHADKDSKGHIFKPNFQ